MYWIVIVHIRLRIFYFLLNLALSLCQQQNRCSINFAALDQIKCAYELLYHHSALPIIRNSLSSPAHLQICHLSPSGSEDWNLCSCLSKHNSVRTYEVYMWEWDEFRGGEWFLSTFMYSISWCQFNILFISFYSKKYFRFTGLLGDQTSGIGKSGNVLPWLQPTMVLGLTSTSFNTFV